MIIGRFFSISSKTDLIWRAKAFSSLSRLAPRNFASGAPESSNFDVTEPSYEVLSARHAVFHEKLPLFGEIWARGAFSRAAARNFA